MQNQIRQGRSAVRLRTRLLRRLLPPSSISFLFSALPADNILLLSFSFLFEREFKFLAV